MTQNESLKERGMSPKKGKWVLPISLTVIAVAVLAVVAVAVVAMPPLKKLTCHLRQGREIMV